MERQDELKLYTSGSREGVYALVRTYAPRLVAFLCGYVSKADAEDIAEDTFLTLLVKERCFPAEKALRSYLYRTARNKALNFIKKHARQTALEDNIPVDGLEEEYVKSEELRFLLCNLRALDEKSTSIVWLVCAEGYSYKEVAKIMGVGVKSVDNTLAYAKKKLKQKMIEEGYHG